jgi:drug/metabolite transporter (DMT)-like permease
MRDPESTPRNPEAPNVATATPVTPAQPPATPAPPARRHRALAGVGWMTGAMAAGTGIDAGVKALQGAFDTPQIVFLRLLFALPVILTTIHFAGGFGTLRTLRWRWHAFRACCASGATFGFFFALGELPLVVAVTIGFAAPLIVAALSRPVLGERVGPVRWAGIATGFAGVLVALQPGTTAWHPAMLVVLGSTTCWALLALSARRIGEDERMGAMVLYRPRASGCCSPSSAPAARPCTSAWCAPTGPPPRRRSHRWSTAR